MTDKERPRRTTLITAITLLLTLVPLALTAAPGQGEGATPPYKFAVSKPANLPMRLPWANGESHYFGVPSDGNGFPYNPYNLPLPYFGDHLCGGASASNDCFARDVIDLSTATPLYPLFGGIVTYQGCATGGWAHYGHVVYITRNVPATVNGTPTAVPYSALYAHLSSVSSAVQTAFATGGSIDANTPIGNAGDTQSTPPATSGTPWTCSEAPTPSPNVHLHFAVYQNAHFCGSPGDSCQGSFGPYGGKAVVPEPMVGQGGSYENLEWWAGPPYPMTAMDLATGTAVPGGSWAAGSVTNGEQIGVGTPVPINITVHDSVPIKQVNITASYPNWPVVVPPYVGTPSVTPSFDGNKVWRILAVCGGPQSPRTCSSGATWTGSDKSATIRYSWNPWSEQGTVPPVVPWLPAANPAPSQAQSVNVCLSFDVVDAAGVENLAPNGTHCTKQLASDATADQTAASTTAGAALDQLDAGAARAGSRQIVLAPTGVMTGTWTPTGSMTTARAGHSATVLPNGTVLVAGGWGSNGVLSSAEVYNPSTGTWTATGAMTIARAYHTATLLPSGTVLVAGGYNNNGGLSSAEVYNPSTGTWTATGSMVDARSYHTATLLPNDTILVAGGHGNNGLLSSAEIYNPSTGIWTAAGSMSTVRVYHTATLLPNGTILVTGGDSYGGNDLSSAEIYNPSMGTWTATGSMTTARFYHTATVLPNGTVLVAGGCTSNSCPDNSAEIYNPRTGTWTATGSMTTTRENHTATLLPNGTVLVAGGWGSNGVLSSAEVYNPSTGTWTATGAMTIARAYHTATLLPSGTVLVAGGYNNNGGLSSAEVYTP